MLILTRRIGETLMVGDNVSITVLGVKGNQVRIGVNAPKEVSVHREEFYQRIQREKGQGRANFAYRWSGVMRLLFNLSLWVILISVAHADNLNDAPNDALDGFQPPPMSFPNQVPLSNLCRLTLLRQAMRRE